MKHLAITYTTCRADTDLIAPVVLAAADTLEPVVRALIEEFRASCITASGTFGVSAYCDGGEVVAEDYAEGEKLPESMVKRMTDGLMDGTIDTLSVYSCTVGDTPYEDVFGIKQV